VNRRTAGDAPLIRDYNYPTLRPWAFRDGASTVVNVPRYAHPRYLLLPTHADCGPPQSSLLMATTTTRRGPTSMHPAGRGFREPPAPASLNPLPAAQVGEKTGLLFGQ